MRDKTPMLKPSQRLTRLISSLALCTMVSAPGWIQAQDEEFKETFTARALSMGTMATGAATTVQITISRWTTDEERRELIATIVEKDSDALVDALNDQKETGFVRIVGRGAGRTRFPSVRLRYAREFRIEGKRVIRLGTDRPIGFAEARQNPRSMDYNISIVELRLDENDEGDGTMAVGVKMKFDKDTNQLVLENRSSEPIRLTRVTKNK